MAKKKFYVVKGGTAPGIYDSWVLCSNILKEHGGSCKGFADRCSAEKFLSGDYTTDLDNDLYRISGLTAYVDGSYEASVGRYGFGCVFLLPTKEIVERYGSGNNEASCALRNVTGEMLGAMFAVKWAMSHAYPSIRICYDYEGIEKWAIGKWKAKTDLTQKYAAAMQEWSSIIAIEFKKVMAHSGETYNERADMLAKRAIEEAAGIPDFRK